MTVSVFLFDEGNFIQNFRKRKQEKLSSSLYFHVNLQNFDIDELRH